MPRRTVSIVIAFAPLVITACGRREPRESVPDSAAAVRASVPHDTTFAGTTAPVQRASPRPGAPPRILRSVEVASGPGYDRVVFEFAGDSVPGYHVEYTTTLVERERALGLPAVREMKLVCDFEGQVEWLLGVAAAGPYRVLDSTGPPRLLVGVRHGR